MLGPCASFSGTEQLHCLVRQKVLAQFDEYGRILQQDITRPLRSLAGQSPAVDVETMAEGLERLRGTFVRKLEENPRFWRTVTAKLGFAVELREEVDRFWKAYGAVVEEQRTRLEHELTGLEETRAVLEKRQAELAAQEQEIAARLKHMETPVWKLPVGLNEAVLLFPLIVAVGFWLCVQHLREGLRLRRIVHGLYVAQDPARRRLTGDQVRVMAPLWIDPADLEQNRAARVAVLAIPPVVFLLACLSVFYLWTLPGSLKGFGLFERYVYGVLYATSLVVLVYGVWVTRAEIQAYSINESAEGP